MSRSVSLVTASLGVALLVPATAEANWSVELPKAPTKIHVIAVRRGHRTIWRMRNHGVAKRRLHTVKLSSDVGFRLSASTAAVDPTHNPIQMYSGTCPPTGSETLPLDGVSFYEPYGQGTATTGLYSDVLTCSGGGWSPPKMAYGPVPLTAGQPGCQFPAENQSTQMPISGQFVNAEYAWFLDGEWGVVCTVPDDPGNGVSNASADPLKFYQQGFRCQVPVGTRSDGQTPLNLKNNDSIEVYQSLGNNVYSITTTCMGKLPSNVTAPTSSTTHWLGCLEPNPFPGGASIKGYGATVTFPDGQYSETCSVPNYHV